MRKLWYQVRSKKRVPVIRTRNVTWSTEAESLEEKAKPNTAARHRPSIKNEIFIVFQVGP